MRFRTILMALSCACATPAAAQVASAPAIAVDQSHTGDQQRRGYAEWNEQLTIAFEIGQQGISPIQAAVEQVMASSGSPSSMASARSAIVHARAAIARSNAMLQAMTLPEFDLLALPEEVRTSALMQGALSLNASRLRLLDGTTAILDAVAKRDLRALTAANARMLATSREMFVMLIPMVEARALALPEESSDRAYFELIGIVYRSYQGNYAAISPSGQVRAGPVFASKLEALADQAEALIGRSEAINRREIALVEQSERQASASANPARTDGNARERRTLAALADMLAQGRLLVAELRAEAAAARKGGQTAALLGENVKRLTAFENAIADCQDRALRAMANISAS